MRWLPYRTLHATHAIGSAAVGERSVRKWVSPLKHSPVALCRRCKTAARPVANQLDY